jgi:hypothetical protein
VDDHRPHRIRPRWRNATPSAPSSKEPSSLPNNLRNLVVVLQALTQPTEALRAKRELAELFDRGFPDDPFAPGD